MWHPKNILDTFLPVFTHFFMSSSGPRSKISKKGNSMICLNMVQQPPRLDVASGPFKHLGPGVQLRLWLWIAVTVMSRDTVRSVSRHSATPLSPPPRVCRCQVYLCHMSLCFIFFSCVTEVESVSGYTGPSFDGGRGSIRPFLYKPLRVKFLV